MGTLRLIKLAVAPFVGATPEFDTETDPESVAAVLMPEASTFAPISAASKSRQPNRLPHFEPLSEQSFS